MDPKPCESCKPQEGQVNRPPGMIFVGWGHGWQVCSTCGGSGVERPKRQPWLLVIDVLPLVTGLFRHDPLGCCLHSVLVLKNVGDEYVESALKLARVSGHPECEAVALLLGRMHDSQRLFLCPNNRGIVI